MPAADSFFQVVGTTPGAGATAPPDNVVLVPPDRFAAVGGAPVVQQFHVGFDHRALPPDPAAAATAVQQRANHLEVAVAGGALVGDSLGTALGAACEDALYPLLLVLLLGVPGVVLAAVVAALVVALRPEHRRREVALLRLCGAPPAVILRLVGAETALTAIGGAVLGVLGAELAVRLALPAGAGLTPGGMLLGIGTGGLVALATMLAPAARSVQRRSADPVGAAASGAVPTRNPWPLRLGLDALLLGGAAFAFC